MARINIPQKKDDDLKHLFMIGGAVGGGATGGPSGAVQGAGTGASAGEFLSQKGPEPQSLQTGGSDSSAMARRMRQLSEDRLQVLRQSEAALAELPEPLRRYYAPAITQARVLEERSRS